MLDPRTHQPSNPFPLYDETRRNRGYHSHFYDNTWEPTNSVLCPSKTEVKSKQEMEDDESGMCSPPLWRTSPPTSPSRAGRTTSSNHYRSLSPASRTQAIVRGQRELMEMVRNMPESNYELSLKDLVEHHRVQQQQQENKTVMVDEKNLKAGGSCRKLMGQVKRSGTFDRRSDGFYLKMAFPSFSLGSKDKKKSKKNSKDKDKKKNEQSLANGSSSTVSPRPSVSDGSGKGGGVEKEWWKKSYSGYRESDSGASSINSGSTKSSGSSSSNSSSRSNSRHRDEKSGGHCWPFIPRSKRQTQK